jgi:hypothetical protein
MKAEATLWGPARTSSWGELIERDVRGLVIRTWSVLRGVSETLGFEVPLTWEPPVLAEAI